MKTILDMLRKSTITAKIGLFIVLVWILCAVFAPFISPHDPEAVDIMQRMKPPAWQDGGSMEHVLGTDEIGRDVLSRLIYGARISLVIGVCSVVVGMTIGVVLGLLAGYIGGWVDAVIMRLVDMMLAFPFTFLALCLVAVLGSSLENVIIVLVLLAGLPIRAQCARRCSRCASVSLSALLRPSAVRMDVFCLSTFCHP